MVESPPLSAAPLPFPPDDDEEEEEEEEEDDEEPLDEEDDDPPDDEEPLDEEDDEPPDDEDDEPSLPPPSPPKPLVLESPPHPAMFTAKAMVPMALRPRTRRRRRDTIMLAPYHRPSPASIHNKLSARPPASPPAHSHDAAARP